MRQVADGLSTKIQTARKQANLTREQLAVALGVSLSTVVRYETGRTDRIPMKTLYRLAQSTGKPLDWFFSGDGDAEEAVA